MGRDKLDFVLLTEAPGRWLPPPVLSLAGHPGPPSVALHLRTLAARLGAGRWSTVVLQAPEVQSVRGQVVLARAHTSAPGLDPERLLARCLSRTKGSRKAGARVITLGGRLSGHAALARRLARETGLACPTGATLEAATLLDAALVVLRWRGVDPWRAQAVVLADPDEPSTAETAIEYLADRTGRVGVWGLPKLRRRLLAERLRSASGAVLETYRSLERCLCAADLAVLTGPECTAGASVVLVDLRPGRPAAGEPREALAVLAPARYPFSNLLRSAHDPQTHRTLTGPVALTRVLFGAPPALSGRPEPGLPAGLVSASLVEAVCSAGPLAVSSCGPDARWTAWLTEMAGRMGFRPVALVLSTLDDAALARSLTEYGTRPYNRFDLPGPWLVTE